MGSVATTVQLFTADQWAQRLLRLYPNSWTGDSAKLAGGVLYSLFNVPGSQLNYLQNGLTWVLNACRLATSTGDQLDSFALDYFGQDPQYEVSIVRATGESDDSFRSRISSNLLQTGGTRADIIRVIELLTDATPRIMEPWNILDMSSSDGVSFCDVDSQANPSRVGDYLPFQALVESVLPSYGSQGSYPIYCVDEGLSCDTTFIIDPQSTWFMAVDEMDLAINRVRMGNTIIWRRYNASLVANYARGGTVYPAAAAVETPVHLWPPCEQALIVLACGSWNGAAIPSVQDDGDFEIIYGNEAPGSLGVDWMAAPATLAGWGVLSWIWPGSLSASFKVPISGQLVLPCPNWNTNFWFDSEQSSSAKVNFTTPCPSGGVLYYGSFPASLSGTVAVEENASSLSVTFTTPINSAYQLMIVPGWNTQFEYTKSSTGFEVNFVQPPPTNSFICWGVLNQPF